ncbi:MAG TPA: TonB-dependent receptor [Ohtaekwangia sp.]|nr:TonB-dependent receptor [Ohtaekwangia sp.]
MNKPKPVQHVLVFFMRVTLVHILISSVSIVFGYAIDSSGQEVLDRKITIQAQEKAIKDVLEQIEDLVDVKFTYRPRLIDSRKKITVSTIDSPLSNVLREIFGENVDLAVIGKQIILKPATVTTNFVALPGYEFQVSGRVTDESGNGIPGVNVIIKGTTQGTTTDSEGMYAVDAGTGSAVLVFSFIGYTTQEVPVSDRTVIDVTMLSDVVSLQEVVVVGYGEQKKVTVTGAVVAVKGEDLVKSPSINLSNSLAGRMPGVVAMQASGEPGYDGSSIRIRGSNTLGSNDALIVIDGIPARSGGIDRLNPADIESISVLKDASAAIYGARAANGVILVTTKRGKTGKPELSYSFNQGWAQPAIIPKLANATQFAEMRNELEVYKLPVEEWSAATEAFKTTGSYTPNTGSVINAPYSPEDFEKFRDGSDPWGHPNTDWYDETLKTWSPQSRHNLQLTGGSENFKYLASLGYQNQDAYYKNAATGYKQYDIRVNLDANINKYIKTSIGILGRQENRFFPTVGASSIFRMQMRGIPTQPAYWPNGLPGPDIENGQNPVVITTNKTGYDKDTRYYLQTNGSVEVTLPWVKGLKFTGTASVDKYVKQTKKWETPWYLYTWDKVTYETDGVTPELAKAKKGPAEPRLTQGSEDQLNVLLGGLITYERKFGNHNLTLLAGTNRETIDNENFSAYRRYFISPSVDQLAAGGNAERTNGGGGFERARLNYFGRVAYNYKEKYLAEFLWRYDGSYMFPENSRYGFFPGIMAGWQISEEDFFKDNVSFISYLKLRASWGRMGNDNIYYDANGNGVADNEEYMEYQYLHTNGFRTYIVGGQEVLTLYETKVPNANITWEVADNKDIGLEGELFQGKVNFEFDVFYNKRTNILWPKYGSVPQTTGMTLPPQNIGKVANRGWEFNIGYNGQAGELNFQVSVNGGYAKNEILFWDEAPGVPSWQRSTGKPMNTYLVYVYDGVFKNEEEITATLENVDYSAIISRPRPGDMKYKDIGGPDGKGPDGKITPDDRIRLDENNIPTFQGGLNIGLQYRNFDCSILFQGATGAKVYLSTGESGSIGNFVHEVYADRWTVENPSSVHPRIADRSDQYYSNGNTYWLKDSDYLRLKNVEIGYTLPGALRERLGLTNLRVYVSGLNLFTVTKSTVFDPEATHTLGQYYPQARILNTGVTVTF